MAEKYMMVSLDENEAKPLGQVLSNDKSMQILKYVTDNDKCTETDISKALNIPLSTVHYNLQNLVNVKLIKPLEFHYSEKGKEVYHYSIANKIIVIAPSKEKRISLLKKLVGSFLSIGLFAGLWELSQLLFKSPVNFTVNSVPLIGEEAMKSNMAEKSVGVLSNTIQNTFNPLILLLVGAVVGIFVFGIWEFIIHDKR